MQEQSFLERIYNKHINYMAVHHEKDYDAYLKEITETLAPIHKHITDTEYLKIEEYISLYGGICEKFGFIQGFKYAIQLVVECGAINCEIKPPKEQV